MALGEAEHAESDAAVGKVGGVAVADSRAAAPGIATPRAAAQQPSRTTFIGILMQPGAAIDWGTLIVSVPVIQAPFPHVPVHILQAPGIGGKTQHGRGLLSLLSRVAFVVHVIPL